MTAPNPPKPHTPPASRIRKWARKVALRCRAEDVPPVDDLTKRISDHLVRLVQILFGVVAAQGLVLYRDVVVSPFNSGHFAAAVALFSVYLMIVWSWIDWNGTMEGNPYDLRKDRPVVEQSERLRLYADLAIVVTYVYILFQVRPLASNPHADLKYLLIGYPIVFLLYLASGLLRIARHGPGASNVPPLLVYLLFFAALPYVYIELREAGISTYALNLLTLSIALIAMRGYRFHRRRYAKRRTVSQAHA